MSTTRTVRRSCARLLCAVVLIIAGVSGTGAAGATRGGHPTTEPAVGGARVAVRVPFAGGGRTGNESPATHGPATIGGFAWDLHKGDGAAVYANMASSDGAISLHVAAIGSNNNGAGQTVNLEVRVNGTYVGSVKYEHLRVLQVSAGQDLGAGAHIGYLGTGTYPTSSCSDGTADGWPYSSSWQVCTPVGIHTHTDVAKGCYAPLGLNAAVGDGAPIAMLSTSYGTTNKSACDMSELNAVNSGGGGTFTEGGFVRVADGPLAGNIYRIAGGVPLHLETCEPFAGCAGLVNVSAASFDAYEAGHRSMSDSGFVRIVNGASAGTIARAVGGTLLPLTSCAPAELSGCAGLVEVTEWAYGNYVAAHATVADGAFVRIANGAGAGTIARAVGGTLLPLSSCEPAELSGCGGLVNVNASSYEGYLAAHPTVADGAFVRIANGAGAGTIARAVGGTLLPLSSCEPAELNGCGGLVNVNASSYESYLAVHPRPRDGSVVLTLPSRRTYVFTGGGCVPAAGGAQSVAVNDSSVSCSAAPPPATPRITLLAAPTLVGKARVGRSLTATHGSWSVPGLTVVYQWYRGDRAIAGATAATYRCGRKDRGKRLHVVVTVTKAGYSAASAASGSKKVRR